MKSNASGVVAQGRHILNRRVLRVQLRPLNRIKKLVDELESKETTGPKPPAQRLLHEIEDLNAQAQQVMQIEAVLLEQMAEVAALSEK